MPYSQLSGSGRRFSFSCENEYSFDVVRFEGEEALSTLYRFEILLASTDSNIDPKRVVDWRASFTLNDGVENGTDTCYQGLIQEFTVERQLGKWTIYKAILVPTLAKLNAFHLSEVYLEKDKDKIFRLIMENAGLPSDYCELRMKNEGADIPAWPYICQYQETYFNFIARWCERLGTYWWFEDVDGQEKAVFSDTWAAHTAAALSLRYQPAGVLDADISQTRRVQSLVEKTQSLPKQVTIMDYNPHRAGSPNIRAGAVVDDLGIGEVYIYGENLKNNEDAAKIALFRAEGIRCRSMQYHGSSSATGLRCGHFVEISGHFRDACNQRFLLTGVRHHGSQYGLFPDIPCADGSASNDFYIAEFTAIPSHVQYRPELLHPWPRIEGSMHAFIDAEGDGKYAELNEKGEYKVQVPFDITHKDENRGSAWIRMATPYAGSDHGMHFPLHKGAEVLLSFINGDPDQPVIIGAVPNSMTASPVVNANQTTSRIVTAGGQEVSFGDQEGDKYTLMKSSENCWIRLGQKNPFSAGIASNSLSATPALFSTPQALAVTANISSDSGQMDPSNDKNEEGIAAPNNNLSMYAQSYNSVIDGPTENTYNGTITNTYNKTVDNTYNKTVTPIYNDTVTNTYNGTVNATYNSTVYTANWKPKTTVTYTNSADITLGAKEVVVIGGSQTMTVGAKNEVWTPLKNEVGLGWKSEFWGGIKSERWGGMKTETGKGAKFQTVVGVNFLSSGMTINQQGSAIKETTVTLQNHKVSTKVLGISFSTKEVSVDDIRAATIKCKAKLIENEVKVESAKVSVVKAPTVFI
jgi:type VI secretion system VgrG family protein